MLLGPRVEDLLRRLTHIDVRPAAFPDNSCLETSLAGVEALLVRTRGAMRLLVPWDLGEFAWERLLEAGHDLAIGPLGLDALHSLTAAT